MQNGIRILRPAHRRRLLRLGPQAGVLLFAFAGAMAVTISAYATLEDRWSATLLGAIVFVLMIGLATPAVAGRGASRW